MFVVNLIFGILIGNKNGQTSPNYTKYVIPGYGEPKDDKK